MKIEKFNVKKTSNYETGRKMEIRVCIFLRNLGWDTVLSPGSKGPADIKASKGRITWCIQVKFRNNAEGGIMKNYEWRNLSLYARKSKCIPIVVSISKIPGNLLMNANYFPDKHNPKKIRDESGYFIGADLGGGKIAFFHNMYDGTFVEP